MNDLEKAEQSGKEHMKAAAEDFKAAATGKIEDLRQTAEEFRQTPADKASQTYLKFSGMSPFPAV